MCVHRLPAAGGTPSRVDMGQQDTPHLLSGSWRQVCLLKHKSDKAKVENTSIRREQARQEQGKECRQEQA